MTLKSLDNTVVCEEDSFVTVTYAASANARTYAYLLLDTNNEPVRDSIKQVIEEPWDESDKTFKIDLSGFTAAGSQYKLIAQATSDSSCQSVWSDTLRFDMKPKPIITDTVALDTCYGVDKTKLSFKISNVDDYDAISYTWYVVGKKDETFKTETTVHETNNDSIENIQTWDPGKYTIKIVANSPTCKSDTVTASFGGSISL